MIPFLLQLYWNWQSTDFWDLFEHQPLTSFIQNTNSCQLNVVWTTTMNGPSRNISINLCWAQVTVWTDCNDECRSPKWMNLALISKPCSIWIWDFHWTVLVPRILQNNNALKQDAWERLLIFSIDVSLFTYNSSVCWFFHASFSFFKRINFEKNSQWKNSSLFCFIQCFMLRYVSELFFKLSVMSSVYMRRVTKALAAAAADLFTSSFYSVLNVSWKSKQEIVLNNLY